MDRNRSWQWLSDIVNWGRATINGIQTWNMLGLGFIVLFMAPVFYIGAMLLRDTMGMEPSFAFILSFLIAAFFSYFAYFLLKDNFAGFIRNFISSFRKISISTVIVYSLVCASFYTTSEGLLSIVHEEGGVSSEAESWFTRYFVFIMTVSLAVSISNLFAPHRSKKKITIFFIWIVLALFSISFSFAFFWEKLESKTIARTTAEAQLSFVEGELEHLTSIISEAKAQSEVIARESLILSWQEQGVETDNDGKPLQKDPQGVPIKTPGYGADTCGMQTSQQEGPRARMRADVAKEVKANLITFSRQEGPLQTAAKDLQTIVNEIRSFDVSDENESERILLFSRANEQITQARRIYNNLRAETGPMESIKKRYRDLASNFASRDKVFTSWGTAFSCPDPATAYRLRGIADTFDNLPPISEVKLKAYSGSEATKEALDRFYHSTFALVIQPLMFIASLFDLRIDVEDAYYEQVRDDLEDQVEKNAASSQLLTAKGIGSDDYRALWIALLVDILLFFFAYLDPASKNFARFLANARKVDYDGSYNMSEDVNLDYLQSHRIKYLHWDFIVIPQGNQTKGELNLMNFMDGLVDRDNIAKRTIVTRFSVMFKRTLKIQNLELWKRCKSGTFAYQLPEGFISQMARRLSQSKSVNYST